MVSNTGVQIKCRGNIFGGEFVSVARPVPNRMVSNKFSILECKRLPWFALSTRWRRMLVPKTHLTHTGALMKSGISMTPNCAGGNEALGSKVAAANQLPSRDIKLVESLDDLPLLLKGGMTIESWGFLYEGPAEEKYWSSSHRKYPYPVGYTVTKLYKCKLFTQIIKEGNTGPLFVITVGKDSFSAATPGKAWASALSSLVLNDNQIGIKRVCGARHFGFENPLVLQKLEEMVKQHRSRIARDAVVNDEMEERSAGNDVRAITGNTGGSSTEKVGKRNEKESGPSGEGFRNQRIEGQQNNREAECSLPTNALMIKQIRLRNELLDKSPALKIQLEELLGQDNFLFPLNWELNSDKQVFDDSSHSVIPGGNQNFGRFCNPQVSSTPSLLDHRLVKVEPNKKMREKNSIEDHFDKGSVGYRDLDPKPTKEMQDTQDTHASALTVQNHKVAINNTMGNAEFLVEEDFTSTKDLVMVINDAESDTERQECSDGSALQAVEEAVTPDKAHIQKLIADKRSESALELLRGMASAGSDIDISDYEVFFPFMFDIWQKQAIQKIHDKKSVLLCAPDGAGKSAVAKHCLLEAFVKNQRTMFVTPYQIQAKQHFQKFEKFFGGENVSGDWQSHKVQRNSMVLVVTLGSLVKLLREGSPIIEDRSVVVMDKFDTICNPTHGSYWEEVLMLLNPQISLLALSIVVDNAVYVVSWMDSIHEHCELVTSRTEPVPKKYLVYDGSMSQLVDSGQIDNISLEVKNGNNDGEFGREGFGPLSSSSMDKSMTWRYVLSYLQKNNMLPSVLILSNMDDFTAMLKHSCKVFSEGLLSNKEIANVKDCLKKFVDAKPSFLQLVGEEDQKGLVLGIATYHNGQLPIWREFVAELINNNLVKVVIASKNLILQTEILVRTVVLCAPLKPYKLDLSLLIPSDFLRLRSLAGRRGQDKKGIIIFMQTPRSNPKQLSTLAFQSSMSISSVFKPSYSLLLSLLARYGRSMSRIILDRTLSEYAPSNSLLKKMRKAEQVEQKIIECQRKKLELEWTLFQDLSDANKRKLEHATLYTLVDVIQGSNDGLQIHTTLTGVLLAVVPGPHELLYMVLTSDNIYRLMPAGAFDHVYETDLPLDIAHKLVTGEDLDPPCLPLKNCWHTAVGGGFGYFASGNATSAKVVKAIQMHMAHNNITKEGHDLREKIQSMAKEISLLQKTRDMLLSENKRSVISGVSTRPISRTWKESERLTKILQEAGAIIKGDDDDSIQIKPFGKLISRLHYMENELWIATILTSGSWKHLTAPEFAGLCSTFPGKEYIMESFVNKEMTRIYKYPKSIHEAIRNLHSLRKQVVSLQNSQNPPVNYDTSNIGLVHAWARAKPGNKEFKFSSINDGSTAWKLRRVAQVLVALHQTCRRCLDDDIDSLDFLSLARIARRAAHLLTRHTFVNGIL